MSSKRKKNSNRSNRIVIELVIFIICILICIVCYNLGIIHQEDLDSFFSFIFNEDIQEDHKKETNEVKNSIEVFGDDQLKIYYIDVGQADCELMICNNETMLIDGGNNEDGNLLVEYIKSLGITKLNYIIGTHAHEDHIGGIDNIIDNFEVENIMLPPVISNTKTYESVLDSIENKNLEITVPNIGDSFKIGDSTSTIMSIGDENTDCNNSSIVVRTEFYNNNFLFMGDLESSYEKKVNWLNTDVLKVGHHGSDTSSSDYFLNQVKPKYAIISVGKDNSYKHPSKSTLRKLSNIGTKIFRTDEDGTIILTSNGSDITFECIKTNTNLK